MAVVRDYVITEDRPSRGAHIVVMDDCYRGISAEELARRRMETARIIRQIDFNAQLRARSADGCGRNPQEG